MHLKEVKGMLSAHHGVNVYRGCTHGCIYCDSRSLCYQMDHLFEDVEVKANGPEILEKELKRKRKPCMVGTGSMSDPYIPLEKQLHMTRRCLEAVYRQGCGASVLTKSDGVLEDWEIIRKIHEKTRFVLQMTLTTADEALCKKIEPNVCSTLRRLEVLRRMREAGIPTVVWLCPILPFINDTEENLRAILEGCAEAGVLGIIQFGFGVTLRAGSRDYFYDRLDRLFPGMKEKYIRHFGNRYECQSPRNEELTRYFHDFCRKKGILDSNEEIFRYLGEWKPRGAGEQMRFEGL